LAPYVPLMKLPKGEGRVKELYIISPNINKIPGTGSNPYLRMKWLGKVQTGDVLTYNNDINIIK